jgi:hypothetical protein
MEPVMTLEVNEKIWTALRHVLNYHWGELYRDYWARRPAERHGHVFESVRLVKHWLEEVPQQKNEND